MNKKAEINELRSRLEEAEQNLEAIRTGDVDAIVIKGPQGEQVFSLTGSDRIYRTIVETMNEAALTVSPAGVVLFCNQAFSHLLKRQMHEVIGSNLADFVAASERAGLQDLLATTQTQPTRKRLLLQSDDENELPVQISGTPLITESGLSVCFIVTDLTRSEAAADFIRFLEAHRRELIESREQLSLARDSAGIGFYDNDLRTGQKFWDERVCQLLGLAKDSPATDEHFWSKVYPDDHAMVKAAIARAFDSRGSGKYLAEYRIVAAGGVAPKWINSRGRVYFQKGEAVRFVGGMQDITERKQAQEELAAAHRQIQNIIDNTPDIIYATDLKERFLMANTALAALFNSTPEQMIGKRRHEIMPMDDAEWHESHDRKVIESGRMLEFEEYSHLENRSITWLTKKFPLRDAQGSTYGVAGISADISDRKRAEEELRRLNETLEDKVSERTHALQAANKMLEERAIQLRELAGELVTSEHRERQRLARILHDGLQQYLVAVKIQLSGLASSQAGEPIKEELLVMDNLLNDAVQVSRTLAIDLSPPILQDADIVPALEWLSRWNAKKHGLRVKLVADVEAPPLLDDIKVLVFESVRELLLNVVKHSGASEAEIRLSRTQENMLQVTVSDNGLGYDAGRMTARGMPDKGGFGLFSIRERIQLIEGEFKGDSTMERGSRFVLTVPMTVLETPKVVQPHQSKFSPTASDAQNRKIRILLTDDHIVMREGLARLLSQESDMEIVGQAGDGQEAVEMIERLQPAVVLMDLSMPRLSGIDATRIIHHKHPDIQVIGLSLYTEDEHAQEMIGAGAVHYLSKAGPPSVLKDAIRRFGKKGQDQCS